MPVQLSSQHHGFREIRVSGDVTLAEIIQACEFHFSRSERPGRTLVDASGVSNIQFDVSRGATILEDRTNPDTAVAVLATNPVVFGVARQMAQLSGGDDRIRVFREKSDALQWLNALDDTPGYKRETA